MPWPNHRTPAPSATPAPVPPAEALRQAVLQASWERDRQVGRRRLALRWTVWFVLRIALPLLVLLGVVLTVWTGLRTTPSSSLPAWPASGSAGQQTASALPSSRNSSDRSTQDAATTPPGPALTADQVPLLLRYEPMQAVLRGVPVPQPPAPDLPDPAIRPLLKPDNWLHSKEP